MTSFRKLWNTLIDSIKPPMLRESYQTHQSHHAHAGSRPISVDRRPFDVSTFSKGR